MIVTLKQLIRSLTARPAYGVTVILTLAITVGAAAAMIAVVDAVVLQPLPYPRSDRLLNLTASVPGPDGTRGSYVLSAVEYLRLRQQATTLEQVEAVLPGESTLVAGPTPETIRSGRASAGFLRLFGLSAVIGRDFSEAEDAQRAQVAVLDGSFWHRRFGGDPNLIGRTVSIDGAVYSIVGVTPEGYRPLLLGVDIWMPLSAVEDPQRAFGRNLSAAARLKQGTTLDQAKAEIQSIQQSVAKDYPQTHSTAEIEAVDLHESLYRSYRDGLLLTLGGVGFLLLIASINIANLALTRVASREGEFALMMSLGASRLRIVRIQLTEMATLVATGSLVGIGAAMWTLPALLSVYPEALPADVRVQLDFALTWKLLGIASLVTFLSGTAPAVRAGGIPVRQAISDSSSRHTGGGEALVRRSLLGAQILFGVVLLGIGASVATSMLRLASSDSGFDADNVLTLQLAPPARFPEPHQRAAFVERVISAVGALPGVVAVGSTQTTFDPNASMQTRIEIEGRAAESGEMLITNIRHITPGYFAALGVRVDHGRAIDQRDRIGSAPVALVSRAFVERYWSGTTAIGKRFRRISVANPPWLTVVGVVEDVTDSGLGVPVGPTIYVPYFQQNTPTARVSLVVRTTGSPEALSATIQKTIWSVDPAQPIDRSRTLQGAFDESIAQPRFRTLLLAIFGLIGLMLAGVGVYGIAAESASQRRREIGVRLALGSTRSEVVTLLVRRALMPVLVGGLLGVLAAAGAQPLIRSTLYQPQSFDWVLAPVSGALLLSAVAMLATLLPAWRASRLPPVTAMRG